MIMKSISVTTGMEYNTPPCGTFIYQGTVCCRDSGSSRDHGAPTGLRKVRALCPLAPYFNSLACYQRWLYWYYDWDRKSSLFHCNNIAEFLKFDHFLASFCPSISIYFYSWVLLHYYLLFSSVFSQKLKFNIDLLCATLEPKTLW